MGAVFILFSKISTCLIHFLFLTLKAFNAVIFTSADSFDCDLFFLLFSKPFFILDLLLVLRVI